MFSDRVTTLKRDKPILRCNPSLIAFRYQAHAALTILVMAKSMYSAAYRQLITAVVSARKKAGLTQRDLAQRLGKPQNYVGRVETEQRRLDFIELVHWLAVCGNDVEAEILKLGKAIGSKLPKPQRRRRSS